MSRDFKAQKLFKTKFVRTRENPVPMEDKKHEGSLPRTIAFPQSSLESPVNGFLHAFVLKFYIGIEWLLEYQLNGGMRNG